MVSGTSSSDLFKQRTPAQRTNWASDSSVSDTEESPHAKGTLGEATGEERLMQELIDLKVQPGESIYKYTSRQRGRGRCGLSGSACLLHKS